jgi:hypothetical protein
LQARTSQARATASLLLSSYTEQSSAMMDHCLTPAATCETLWAIVELLDQACDASEAHTRAEVSND